MKFVPHFSDIAEPMRKLLKQDTPWQWDSQQGKAFDRLKQEISSNRVLAHFDTKCRTIVSTDASAVALGAVLLRFRMVKNDRLPFLHVRCRLQNEHTLLANVKHLHASGHVSIGITTCTVVNSL